MRSCRASARATAVSHSVVVLQQLCHVVLGTFAGCGQLESGRESRGDRRRIARPEMAAKKTSEGCTCEYQQRMRARFFMFTMVLLGFSVLGM